MASAKPGQVVSPNKLAHVVLQTNKFAEMVQFWHIFLGAKIVHDNGFLAFLTYDDEHHRIAIAGFPGTKDKDPTTSGLAHIAFTFSGLKELATSYEQRKAHGIVPFWCINHGTTTSLYYRDPDGNEIETQVDNFDDNAEATEYMTSPAFMENPFGVEFNPDDLVVRVRSGEDEKQIKKRPDVGPRRHLLERTIPPPTLKTML